MRYVFHGGEVIPKRQVPRSPSNRSHLPAPMLISDRLGDVWNPVDGKTYDSRSNYYRAVKDAGCVIAGDDSSLSRPKTFNDDGLEGIEEDIKTAYEQLSGRT